MNENNIDLAVRCVRDELVEMLKSNKFCNARSLGNMLENLVNYQARTTPTAEKGIGLGIGQCTEGLMQEKTRL